MSLKASYDKEEDIPEQYRELFEERGGKFILTKIEGIKTEADVQRVQRALDKEKKDHTDTKTKLTAFGELNADEVHAKLDRFDELEAAAAGKLDEAKVEELVEKRLRAKLAPVERERDKAKSDLATRDATVAEFQGKERTRSIQDNVRAEAVKAKIVDTAMDDVLMLAGSVFDVGEDGKIVTKDGTPTPGVDAAVWLSDMQKARPHWWPPSEGGGAQGSGKKLGGTGINPWKRESWNMTEQGKIVREHGMEKAQQYAKAAGTTVGGPMPVAAK